MIQWIPLCPLQVYPEPSSQKTIFSSVVFCIHRKEGCDWSGELRNLKVRTGKSMTDVF